MSADFYFKNGRRFWDFQKIIISICDLELSPASAPLGEEVTGNENFVEASYTARIRLPNIDKHQKIGFSFQSLHEPDERSEVGLIWNPKNDSLIHRISVQFYEIPLVPGKFVIWPDWINISRESYLLYKKLFVSLSCDEARGLTENFDTIFHWIKSNAAQMVIFPYEDGRDLTETEYAKGDWCGMKNSRLVFPHYE